MRVEVEVQNVFLQKWFVVYIAEKKSVLIPHFSTCRRIFPGGMVFDSDQQRAVRRRTIPPPSSISFASSTTYEDILEIGKNIFSPEFIDCPLDFFCLAHSSGILDQIKYIYLYYRNTALYVIEF